ncbi:DUF808 domain-containing protein [Novosphingobium sediminicola]|uniref:ABC transporter n=1 Tax=Novosphingobium sediminicola TaxID=563162 RepID=A0A7W6CF41_9SPHN|nr:DUF808 domain-containing protein [Novosphingobium sediminicola]MBB3953123.1 hypothetical protein [Novosphingobium sediminicola]
MSVGLIALLDDVAMIAKAAAASLDDMAAGVAQAGSKAAGVVIDDAAVTPAYVASFTPDRELPVIARIARGSLFNKLVILLPLALALSALLPWAITPLLMLGGLFLCYEGAEKLLEKLGGEAHGETPDGPVTDAKAFEAARVKGAVRTDLILSAEIMAIALAEVADKPLIERAVILGIVGVGITVLVYGVVGLIVKADDIGLHLARGGSGLRRAIGRALVQGTPPLLTLLANVGTAAMLWVGGGILLHGGEQLGLAAPAHWQHDTAHAVEAAAGAALGWIVGAGIAGIAGLAIGMIVAGALHGLPALLRRA